MNNLWNDSKQNKKKKAQLHQNSTQKSFDVEIADSRRRVSSLFSDKTRLPINSFPINLSQFLQKTEK